MKEPNIKRYDLHFKTLYARDDTDMIVIHHTGDEVDDDLSAEDIHEIHLNNGWSGCGYHYIIRKNGQVEQGRPEWAIGSHAYGENWHTIGIHLSGNFEIATPTEYQIESLAYLIAYLCDKYDIRINEQNIVGHRDLMATLCPGENVYNMMDTIRGKAQWYRDNYQGGD